jgi:predicted secreted Zn-dependent protease
MRRLGALLAMLAAQPVGAQATDAFAGIPNLHFKFYDVSGGDAAAIRAKIDARRPSDPRDPAATFDAATDWSIRGRWRGDGHGSCDLASTVISYAATVTLPRLSGDVPDAVRAAWDRYIAALERHEAGHARYAYEHRFAVLAAVKRATCATASAAAAKAIAKIAAHDRAYDTETQHGAAQGATFP